MEPQNQSTTLPRPAEEITGPDLNKPKSFKKLGVILAAVGLVFVIITVGCFLVVKQKSKPIETGMPTPTPTPASTSDTFTAVLEDQSTSDEIVDIEADLNSTDLAEIDRELTDIESELSLP